jgi:poly(A) polymerase
VSLHSIKNWVKKLLPGKKNAGNTLQATLIPRAQHNVSRKHISKNALNVLYRLNNNGYEAYLVGGCVRDLLLGIRPKDFDIATNAKPEQIKRLFNNCRLIGRRFRLAHIYYGHEVMEVATFRAGQTKASPKHVTSDSGMLLRDNVFGTLDEDAVRRDFTVNALYYRITDFAISDFCEGMQDIEARVLRLIGEPTQRYREDPVRMLRAVRFAAKLDFTLHPDTQAPIPELAHLLTEVPSARLFEECLKLLMSGHGVKSVEILKNLGLLEQLIPDTTDYTDQDWHLVQAGIKDTDERIQNHLTTSPSYLFAVLFWPIYAESNDDEDVFQSINKTIAIPKRISVITYAIWDLQHRLEQVKQHQVHRLISHPSFRAAFDFLSLRSTTHAPELIQTVSWWTSLQKASDEEWNRLVQDLPKISKRRKRRRPKQKSHDNA